MIVKHPVDTALCTSDLQLPASMSCRQLWCPWNSHTFILCSYLLCMFANWTLVASLHFHLELILSSQISSQILIFLEMLHHRNEKPCYAHFQLHINRYFRSELPDHSSWSLKSYLKACAVICTAQTANTLLSIACSVPIYLCSVDAWQN